MSVRGDRRPPSTPTNKPSDPKVLRHPFRDRGLPLPWRRQARQNKRPCRRPGQRHWPRAPDSGGGPLCMPLIFWTTQTMAASDLLGVGTCGSTFTPYISPTTTATTIQMAYRCYITRWVTQQRAFHSWYVEWPTLLLLAQVRLEYNMTCTMRALTDSDCFVYSVCDYDWIIDVDPMSR